MTKATAEIVQFQKKQEVKFMCSACGADRGCDCNAPAVEKLAEMVEQRRKAKRAYNERKRQQKQQSGNIPKPRNNAQNPFIDDHEDDDVEEGVSAGNLRTAFLLRADQSRISAKYSGPIDREVAQQARAVADAWDALALELERKSK